MEGDPAPGQNRRGVDQVLEAHPLHQPSNGKKKRYAFRDAQAFPRCFSVRGRFESIEIHPGGKDV